MDRHKKLKQDTNQGNKQIVEVKLNFVKNALLETLAENKNGISLAQLPQHLKKKLPFPLDLNELGFPKLKDLVSSMADQIKVELISPNHPFAYLIRQNRQFHQTVQSDDFKAIPKGQQQRAVYRVTHNNNSEDLQPSSFNLLQKNQE